MKALFTLLTISLFSVISFAQVQKKNHVTIIKIDTTITGQADTLIFNFDGDLMGNLEEIMKSIPEFDISLIDSSLQMSIMDSSLNFGFEKDFQMPEEMIFGMPNEMPFGFGAPDNSAKIGISPARTFKGEGVMIETVSPISLGAALGLQTGDIIVELNKNTIKDFDSLVRTLKQYVVGDEANITVLRNGKKKKVSGFFIPAQGGNNMQREIRIQRP
jgi:membrane-associated protease RseP (regulator of RpoE activity)